jgi:hypothetical protein
MRKSYLSFGGGVQSTTLAELIFEGTIPAPDAVVFADTGNEPEAVSAWVIQYERKFLDAGVPFLRAKRGGAHASLGDAVAHKAITGRGSNDLPFWVPSPEGRGMPVRRGCTFEWKVKPIRRIIRKHFGKDVPTECWLGISLDECQRMKRSVDASLTYQHPLIDLGYSRARCLLYLAKRSIVAPRSACVFCPFRNQAEWAALTTSEREYVIALDASLQTGFDTHGRFGGLRDRPFLRPDLVPFASLSDFDQPQTSQLDLWDNECAGVCGV